MSYGGLKITGASGPPFSLDKCTQKLEIIADGGWHRTVNGDLVCTRLQREKKYRTHCHGEGPAQPGWDRLHLGDVIQIHSIQRLWQNGVAEKVTLARPVVPGSLLVVDGQGAPLAFDQAGDHVIPRRLGYPYYVGYCPLLTVRLTALTLESARGELSPTWAFTGEEV